MITYLLWGMLFTFMIDAILIDVPENGKLTWGERLVTVLIWPIMLLFLIIELLRK